MDQVENKTILGFSILDAIYWGFYAASAGFLSSYMLENGLSSSFLSIDLAIFMVFSFIGAFFWGSKCDKAKSNKKIFLPEFIGTVLIALVIYFVADKNVMMSALLYPLFGFMVAPLGSSLDAWMLRSFNRDGNIYGRARGTGSAGYAIAALVIGQLTNYLGYVILPIGMISTAIVVFVLAFLMKESAYEERKKEDNSVKADPKGLLKITPYIFLCVVMFLTGLAISPYNNLKIVVLKSVGGDVGMLGIDSFVGVMVQALFIFISGKLNRLPRQLRLFLVSVCVAMTMILAAIATNPYIIVLGTIFTNISYGIMLPTSREITEAYVPQELKTTAHSLTDAMYGYAAGMIALLYSGTLMDMFGVRFVMYLGAGIMMIPIIMTLFTMSKEKKASK